MNTRRIVKYISTIIVVALLAAILIFVDAERLGIPAGVLQGNVLTQTQAAVAAKLFIAFVAMLVVLYYLRHFDEFVEIPIAIVKNWRLIVQLSVNDFKTKFAGSYLGMFWAFVQPIITVVVYWLVFEKAFHSGPVLGVPFALWLVAGIVPWFFFSDGINGGTNALCEYHYLVKKVVFQIDVLPVVKVFSSLYVNLFFIAFTLVLYTVYGYYPDGYTLQILYYALCAILLTLAISYVTSAVVCFFRDLTQVINIILQVGVWVTPIMWNFDSIAMPSWARLLFQLNPMFYIVQGYRDALINHIWLWERPGMFVYFWCVTGFLLVFGTVVFRKLKVHFADVL